MGVNFAVMTNLNSMPFLHCSIILNLDDRCAAKIYSQQISAYAYYITELQHSSMGVKLCSDGPRSDDQL